MKKLINNDLRIDSEGGKHFFGEHFDLETAKKLYSEEEYDDGIVKEVVHCYVHFGIVWIDDEKSQGWSVHRNKPNSMKGYRKATELLFQKDIDLRNKINYIDDR